MMKSSQTAAANPEIADSLSSVESDGERESFHASFDSARDSTSLAVVSVVATASGKDPQALPPLETVIDTDALDELATESATGAGSCERISFRYGGFDIRVTGEGVIDASPIANP